jgi:hypothetical protein
MDFTGTIPADPHLVPVGFSTVMLEIHLMVDRIKIECTVILKTVTINLQHPVIVLDQFKQIG